MKIPRSFLKGDKSEKQEKPSGKIKKSAMKASMKEKC